MMSVATRQKETPLGVAEVPWSTNIIITQLIYGNIHQNVLWPLFDKQPEPRELF